MKYLIPVIILGLILAGCGSKVSEPITFDAEYKVRYDAVKRLGIDYIRLDKEPIDSIWGISYAYLNEGQYLALLEAKIEESDKKLRLLCDHFDVGFAYVEEQCEPAHWYLRQQPRITIWDEPRTNSWYNSGTGEWTIDSIMEAKE